MPEPVDLVVHTGRWSRNNAAAEYALDDIEAVQSLRHIRVAEISAEGEVIDPAVPCQLDRSCGNTNLILLLSGKTAANSTRRYRLEYTDMPVEIEALVRLTDGVLHQEQESYRIDAPAASYVYHKQGAGFASIFDRDGNDWLSYRPRGGSDGKYRGIPNLAHPENHFHPGGAGCSSRILNAGPLKITIASVSNDGKWECRWEVFPTHARLTVLKVDHPYWFLYEGTPGGQLDEAGDFCVTSDGVRRQLSERWEYALPHPEWIYFGASDADPVLYLAHHESDQHIDSYWPMERNMTVFGFGRAGLKKFMTQTPAQFTIGLAESSRFGDIANIIGAATQLPVVAILD